MNNITLSRITQKYIANHNEQFKQLLKEKLPESIIQRQIHSCENDLNTLVDSLLPHALYDDNVFNSHESTLLYIHVSMNLLKKYNTEEECWLLLRDDFSQFPKYEMVFNKCIPYYYWGICEIEKAHEEFLKFIAVVQPWFNQQEEGMEEKRELLLDNSYSSLSHLIQVMYRDMSLMFYHFGQYSTSIKYYRESLNYYGESNPCRVDKDCLILAFEATILSDSGHYEEACQIWERIVNEFPPESKFI
jgi:tetratricopeptide (TPR) repeat protein